MQEVIEDLLSKRDIQSLEISFKNGDSFSVALNEHNTISFTDNGLLYWEGIYVDGCVHRRYFVVSEISHVTGIYGCPEVQEDYYDDDDIEVAD